MRDAFFLKINRDESFAISNLSRWIDIAYLLKADCYIICDRDDITNRIKNELFLCDNVTFLKSIKNDETKKMVELVSRAKVWHNAAFAHLSTFIYAKQFGYDYFWNIDADDTWLVIPISRCKQGILEVERYAKENNYCSMALDMWRSVKDGKAWTFGITYLDNRIEWVKVFYKYGSQKGYDRADNIQIDSFFTYLSKKNQFKIGTFYFDNLRFIHYANELLEKPIESGIYHWHDGFVEFPIRGCFAIDEYSKKTIFEDVIKIDIGISEQETRNTFTYYARDINNLASKSKWGKVVNKDLCALKQQKFMKKHGNAKNLVLFGAGHALKFNYMKYSKLYDVKYVCDNNRELWGKEVYKGIKCIAPSDILGMNECVVVIMIYSMTTARLIKEQLNNIGIKEVDYLYNWLRCAE